jgi:hypothetical protein
MDKGRGQRAEGRGRRAEGWRGGGVDAPIAYRSPRNLGLSFFWCDRLGRVPETKAIRERDDRTDTKL